MPPQFLTAAQFQQLEQALLGRTNIRPRSITEDKLAVGAASAAIVRDGSISDIHIDTLSVATLTGGTISGEVIVLAADGQIRSADYSAGVAGFSITGGVAEFQDVTVRGVLVAEAGSDVPPDVISDGDLGAVVDLTVDGSISANYSPGVSGWAIDGDGTAEFNDVIVRGAVYATDGDFTGTIYTGSAGRYIAIGDAGANQITFESGETSQVEEGYLLMDTYTGGPGVTNDRMTLRPARFGSTGLETELVLVGQGTSANPGFGSLEVQDFTSNHGVYRLQYLGTSYLVLGFNGLTMYGDSGVSVQRLTGAADVGPYLDFNNSSGTRLGYVGYGGTDDLRLWNEDANGQVFIGTNDALRLQITDAGNMQFGSSSSPQDVFFNVLGERSAATIMTVINYAGVSGNNPKGILVRLGSTVGTNDPDNGDDFMLFQRGDGTTVGSIDGNASGGVRYNTTSDQRLKVNIRDFDALELFDALRWRSFDMGGEPRHGLVAQEVWRTEGLRPYVTKGGRSRNGKIPEPWMVDYPGLVPLLGAKLADVDRRLRELEARA